MYNIISIATGVIVARFTERQRALDWLEANNNVPDKVIRRDGWPHIETTKPAELFRLEKVKAK